MTYTPDQLSSMMDQLTARVTALDGAGLKPGANNPSFVNQTNRKIAGLQTDLNQSVLTLEGLLNKLQAQFTQVLAAIKTAFGPLPPPVVTQL